ncbi:hypothetical protein [Actinokineospora enzanensis]|uniref:hypothetical protein n=1 Tax=Actinokineospora enzanensis TaxID=155975 RepID=UPI00037895BB|nr:hypothetical protein [Actinokineospora enzanensis]
MAEAADLDTFWLNLYLGQLRQRGWYVGPLGDPHRPLALGAALARPTEVDVVMVWSSQALAYRAPRIDQAGRFDPLRPLWVSAHYRGAVSWVLRWALTLDPPDTSRSVLYAVGPNFAAPHSAISTKFSYAPTQTLAS